MADYADALADRRTLEELLRQAAAEPVNLPAVPAPVYQPVPLPERVSRVDVPSLRLASAGVCAVGVGGGFYLGGLGIHEAGPYLPWLAGSFAALAALVVALKSKAGGSGSSGTQINISGGRNRFRGVR